MNISVATTDHVERIHEIMESCAAQLRAKGYHNWDHITVERTHKKVQKGKTYIANVDQYIVATITYGDKRPTFSIPEDKAYWSKTTKPAYIRSLAVDPAYQSHGYGKACMLQLEDQLKHLGYSHARLTAVTSNALLQRMYTNLGYREVQQRFVPERGVDLTFFEKKL